MLIVLTGKTASGKDTIMSKLLAKYPQMKRVVTTTSRSPRENEQNGVDYHFISEEDFRKKIDNGDFLEYVEYGGNLYGTEKKGLENTGDLIWRIDPSRAGKIKDTLPAVVIYVTTSDDVVLQRLKDRNLTDEEIQKRMDEDQKFWEQYKNSYDFVVENVPGKLDETLEKIYSIIDSATKV
ncbi:hypothetical protein HYU96_03640 [Candidatus Daviesbacteria bacterium]|nr:hypothetical protein [Candidatus Daviesbacteria bacterium]